MQVLRTACLLAVLAAAADAAPAPADDAAPPAPVADKRLGLGGLVGSVASASAGLSASSSSASSSSSGSDHDPGTAYGPPVEAHDGKAFDLWTFKKELLRSLFQIVKALKGGLLALKGHVLKTKGNLLATKGRLLAAKGEAIKEFGKSVAANAFASSHPSAGYGPPSGYPASGHSSGYASSGVGGSHLAYSGPPPPVHPQPISSSGFGGAFSSPAQLYPVADLARVSNTATGSDGGKALPEGATAGLLILKPVNLPSAKVRSLSRGSEEHISAQSTNLDFSLLPHPDLLSYGQPFHF